MVGAVELDVQNAKIAIVSAACMQNCHKKKMFQDGREKNCINEPMEVGA
jgi:hypothetical protein